MATKRMALGKGLAALIPEAEQDEGKTFLMCGIEEVIPNRSQPRKRFDETKLQELADSIKKNGILEPLIVRKVEQGYEIVVGERRWRAAQKAGLREVPVLVKEVEGREALEISLIENLQRENLNPIEEAEGYRRLIEEFDINQEELAWCADMSFSNMLRNLCMIFAGWVDGTPGHSSATPPIPQG